MNKKFNQLEIDFIEYLADRRNEPFDKAEKIYNQVRNHFEYFQGKRYQRAVSGINQVYWLYHNPQDQKNLIESYKSIAYSHLLRYLSYSYPKSFSERLHSARILLRKKQYKEFFQFGSRYFKTAITKKDTIDLLLENTSQNPVIVDYGCGTAPFSSKIAQKIPSAKIYLIDIDTVVLDFTVFRFRKYQYNFEVIKVTNENLYPVLPEHELCLANEVMEHVYEPLRVYGNIHSSMIPGGLLFGNFADQTKHMLHVSPDLSALREKISQDYVSVDIKLYRKVR